jgi:asparagine N-glycosylation enzyme membrane subunit Stt3
LSESPVARGLDDFKRLLTEFRGLSTWAVGSALTVPFAAALTDLSPPWPKGVVLVTAIVELLVLALVFQFFRTARKSLINWMMATSVLALAVVSPVYLLQLSLYTYEVPTTKERFVKGDECTPWAKQVYSDFCPDLGHDQLREAEYSAERLWTRRSVAAARVRLVLLWAAAFVTLSAALGSFLVFQLRSKRKSKRHPTAFPA